MEAKVHGDRVNLFEAVAEQSVSTQQIDIVRLDLERAVGTRLSTPTRSNSVAGTLSILWTNSTDVHVCVRRMARPLPVK